jgi:hypothetical protein
MNVDKWEYFVKEIKTTDANGITQHLMELGEKSWELVAVQNGLYYFKKMNHAYHVA